MAFSAKESTLGISGFHNMNYFLNGKILNSKSRNKTTAKTHYCMGDMVFRQGFDPGIES